MSEQVISWIKDNIQWLFSGIGVLIVSLLLAMFRPFSTKRKAKTEDHFYSNRHTIVAGHDVVINTSGEKDNLSNQNSINENQKTVHILFIDDEEFQVVQMLKNDGWKAVSRIDDPNSIRTQEIVDSDIIFVDIIGVGKALGFKNQGIGLAAEIKRRYPPKRVVIYSGEEKHSVFDSDLHAVDNWLPKNAEPIQFIQEIENYESNRD